jgi:hypothetical protein
MRLMSDAPKPPARVFSPAPLRTSDPSGAAIFSERCGRANVYRRHAVWRCADGGDKTDCCGW